MKRVIMLLAMMMSGTAVAEIDSFSTVYRISTDTTDHIVTDINVTQWRQINDWKWGLQLGTHKHSDNFDTVKFNEGRLHFSRNYGKKIKFSGNVGSMNSDVWSTHVGALGIKYQLFHDLGFNFNIDRSIKDKSRAIHQGISRDRYRLSSKSQFFDNSLTIMNSYTLINHSDTNVKTKSQTNITYAPDFLGDFDVRLISNRAKYDFNPTEYYAPKLRKQGLIGFGYTKKYKSWKFSGTYAKGCQEINHTDRGELRSFSVTLSKQFKNDAIISLNAKRVDERTSFPFTYKAAGIYFSYPF